MNTLSDKTLVMLVAPSATGKSTIMNEVARQSPDFSYVRSFTTRAPRPGDQHYSYLSELEAKRLREEGKAITYAVFPTTGAVYGTTLESYPNVYNLLDTLSGSVEAYRALDFRQTITISLRAPMEDWRKWFTARYPNPSDDASKRLEEARFSIAWSLADRQTTWLINDDSSENIAKRLIAIAQGSRGEKGEGYARAILECIEKGVIWT